MGAPRDAGEVRSAVAGPGRQRAVRPRRVLGLVLLAVLVAGACARVRPLEGGPADRDPPRLVAVTPPDSTTGLSRWPRFELQFSENLAAASVRRSLRIDPYVRLGEVHVDGARVVVTLAESLPPDTTVVLTVGKALQDRPGRDNRLPAEIALVYSTGPALRGGAALGRVTVKGRVEARVTVQWEPVPADTGIAARARRGPHASTDAEGLFRLLGLPPERNFLLRAFLDANENALLEEEELSAVYPETLRLAPGAVERGLAWNIVDPREPGTVSGVALVEVPLRGRLCVAVRRLDPPEAPEDTAASALPESAVTRADTLKPLPLPVEDRASTPWDAAYRRLEPRGWVRDDWVVVAPSPRGDYSVRVPPGRHALAAFVDARRDTVAGLYVRADSSALAWEPLVLGDTLAVPPGGAVRARTLTVRAP